MVHGRSRGVLSSSIRPSSSPYAHIHVFMVREPSLPCIRRQYLGLASPTSLTFVLRQFFSHHGLAVRISLPNYLPPSPQPWDFPRSNTSGLAIVVPNSRRLVFLDPLSFLSLHYRVHASSTYKDKRAPSPAPPLGLGLGLGLSGRCVILSYVMHCQGHPASR